MIKEDYIVDVDIINNSMIKHYINKGYKFKIGETIKVKAVDLPPASRKKVKFTCDYCGDEFFMILKTRNNNMKKQILKKDACRKCKIKKTEETNLIKYGVKNVFQNEDIKNKQKKTLMDRYGVEHVSQIEGFLEKCKNTNLKKYGKEYYTQTEDYSIRCSETWANKTKEEINSITTKRRETLMNRYGEDNPLKVDLIKNKMINTNIERYGVENVFQNEEIKEKIRRNNLEKYEFEYYSQTPEFRKLISEKWKCFSKEKIKSIVTKTKKTSLDRYGVDSYTKTKEYLSRVRKTNRERYGSDYPMQNHDIRMKAYKTFIKNGSMPASIQQSYLHKLLGGEINFFTGKSFLDIAFVNEKIYIEYDGGGHNLSVKLKQESEEDFQKKETRRYFALKKEGWKCIKIKSSADMLPQDEEILKLIEMCKNILKSNNWVEINIDKKRLITYSEAKDLDLNLRRIYKNKEVA